MPKSYSIIKGGPRVICGSGDSVLAEAPFHNTSRFCWDMFNIITNYPAVQKSIRSYRGFAGI